MISPEELARGKTLAEAQGMTAELGRAIAFAAGEALAAGRLRAAREILEGLVTTNPRDPQAWALLSTTCRRQGQAEAARLCAEAAVRLAPADAQVRLVRAEALLASGERERGRAELEALGGEGGPPGHRARVLLAAMGARAPLAGPEPRR
jgi:predicted Zn-dependent protease